MSQGKQSERLDMSRMLVWRIRGWSREDCNWNGNCWSEVRSVDAEKNLSVGRLEISMGREASCRDEAESIVWQRSL